MWSGFPGHVLASAYDSRQELTFRVWLNLVIQALQQIIMKIFIRSKAVSWYLFIALQYLNHQN